MRMIDRSLEIEAAAPRRWVPAVLAGFRTVAFRLYRAWQSRRMIHRLSELEDHRLLDIGLRRADLAAVRDALCFSDSGLHLMLASRDRARRHVRGGRTD